MKELNYSYKSVKGIPELIERDMEVRKQFCFDNITNSLDNTLFSDETMVSFDYRSGKIWGKNQERLQKFIQK